MNDSVYRLFRTLLWCVGIGGALVLATGGVLSVVFDDQTLLALWWKYAVVAIVAAFVVGLLTMRRHDRGELVYVVGMFIYAVIIDPVRRGVRRLFRRRM